MIIWSLAIVLAAQASAPVAAPSPSDAIVVEAATSYPQPGQWVRVTTIEPARTFEGRVKALSDDSLVIDDGSQPGRVPISRTKVPTQTAGPVTVRRELIRTLDIRERDSKKARGLGLGAAGGAALGGLIGISQETEGSYAGLSTIAGILGGTMAGAVVGVIAAPGAKWAKNVPLDRVRVAVGPVRRGVGLSIRVAF